MSYKTEVEETLEKILETIRRNLNQEYLTREVIEGVAELSSAYQRIAMSQID